MKDSLRRHLHEVIFEADTKAGRAFDIVLLWLIVLSVLAVLLESVASIRQDYGDLLYRIEWFFTVLFTAEYLLRLFCVQKPSRYVFSFFGLIDLLSIIPTYLSIFVSGTQSLLVIRAVRLLRVFRVLKLVRFLGEADVLMTALRASRAKITVFIGSVLTFTVIIGAVMYLVEGEEHGFTSIPKAIYWAIVTLTTVGYGDITPQTTFGQALSAIVMILGYGIIAVPTGIVSVELSKAQDAMAAVSTQACHACGRSGHDSDASFCKYCSGAL